MKYRGIFEYEYPAEHKPPVSIDVHLHGDCVKGKIIEWEYRPLEQEPTTKNNLGVREFEEIVVEYPPEDLCTYPEYKGKPYFSIKYEEGNDCIIGYGTYNPQVLSRYLKDYFMPTTKNDLVLLEKTYEDFCKCEGGEGWLKIDGKEYGTDVGYAIEGVNIFMEVFKRRLAELPSVTPQEPFINKPCVSSGVCEHDKQKVLEKIRAEITDCLKALDDIEKSGLNIYLPNEISGRRLTYQQCLEFIDKYKAESEE